MARGKKNDQEANFLGAEGAALENQENTQESVYTEVPADEVVDPKIENQDPANEVDGEGKEFDGSAPSADDAAAEATDDRVWKVGETEVSKSEFIRHQFVNENLSRKQIAEQFEINYRTVYGATMNMTNGAEPSTRGRSASATKILVTADGRVVTYVKDAETGADVLHINNVAVEDNALVITPAVVDEQGVEVTPAVTVELTEVDRNTWIKEQVANGVTRADVASALGLSYGVVYGITKDSEGSSNRHEVTVINEDGTEETISRSEYIRRLFATGKTKAEIAKELGVDYPIVWAALKGLKPESEKLADAIDKLEKFADQVEQSAEFAELITQLKLITLKAPVEETTEATEEVAPTEEVQDSVEGATIVE
ncbi:hypothetical protein D3C71_448980 [compost metagenome]